MPYPTPPGPRIAYDIDGTVGLIQRISTREMFDIHPRALRAMNAANEGLSALDTSGVELTDTVAGDANITLLFPEPLRLYGMLRASTGFSPASTTPIGLPQVQVSKDSTNGIDGSWETIGSFVSNLGDASTLGLWVTGIRALDGLSQGRSLSVQQFYRMPREDGRILGWETLSGGAETRNVRALRISRVQADRPPAGVGTYGSAVVLHLYGEPDSGASDERLALWRPATNLPLAAGGLDWGDTPLGSSDDRAFRVKNLSAEATARDISLSVMQGYPNGSPSTAGFMLLSNDGGETWEPSVTIDSLSPGATSSLIQIRRVVPTNATLGSFSPRLIAQAGGWD